MTEVIHWPDDGRLHVIIPTHRRMPRQATLGYLPADYISRTTLVVDEQDHALRKLYANDLRGVRFVVVPSEIDTIAKKRAWIIRHATGRIVMFDDDLRFAVRSGEGTKLKQADQFAIRTHLDELQLALRDATHAGWSARQGNNTCEAGGWQSTCRQMFCLGYDAGLLNALEREGKIQMGRIQTREDMDLTLQLLRLGHDNVVQFDIACDQVAGFAAKGGCTDERTLETSDRDAVRLAELHPGLVKVVEKQYKGSLNRKEVVVSWKKALESSRVAP